MKSILFLFYHCSRVKMTLLSGPLTALVFIFINTSMYATTITSSVTYTSPVTIPDDLVISNNAVVTVLNAELKVNGHIEIEPGSRLVIDNSTLEVKTNIFVKNGNMYTSFFRGGELEMKNNSLLTGYNGEPWGRVEVWGANGEFFSTAKFIAENSKIEKAKCAVVNYRYAGTEAFAEDQFLPGTSHLMDNRGGILILESVNFLDNNISIDFIDNIPRTSVIGFSPSSSYSRFENLSFKIVSLPYNNVFPIGSTMYEFRSPYQVRVTDAQGISFLGCTFEMNRIDSYYSAVNSVNSDIRIAERNTSAFWGDFSFTLVDRPVIERHSYGVEAYYDGSFRRFVLQNAIINEAEMISVYFKNSNYAKVINNSIEFSNNINGTGIVIDGSTGYDVQNNNIVRPVVGIQVENSGPDYNVISNNKVINSESTSLYAVGNNIGFGPFEGGLKFQCNDVSQNVIDMYDILVDTNSMYGAELSGISPIQGHALLYYPSSELAESYAAGNRFNPKSSLPTLDPQLHFCNRTVKPIMYFFNTSDPLENPLHHNLPVKRAAHHAINCQPGNKFGVRLAGPLHIRKGEVATINSIIESKRSQGNLSANDSLYIDGLITLRKNIIDTVIQHFLYNDTLIRYDSMAFFLDIPNMPVAYVVQLSELYLTMNMYDSARSAISHYIHNNQGMNPVLRAELERLRYLYEKIEFLYTHNDNWPLLPQQDKDSIEFIYNHIKDVYSYPLASYILKRYKAPVKIADLPLAPLRSSVSSPVREPGLFIYPNPAENLVNIMVDRDVFDGGGAWTLSILNSVGHVVKRIDMETHTQAIDVSGLPAGLYFINACGDHKSAGTYNGQFIKK